jgi:hypothetical protein
VGAADELGVGHALQLDVIDVAASACDESSVFLAHDARANTFNAHVLISLPEFCCPPFPSKFGGLNLIIESNVGDGYSAACETFMRPAASSTDFTILW